jgi:hypothetical protein
MKTQIIALESHDDLISVRDRMSWAKSPRILLVWPKFEKVTLRPVDLRVLQQHARYLGADLGLVTRRADVRRDAIGFGIPVFDSTAAAQRDLWPERRSTRRRGPRADHPNLRMMKAEAKVNEAKWKSSPAARIGFFLVGVLAALSVAALFVPRAAVKLTPLSQRQNVTISVIASPSNPSVSINGDVPVRSITLTVTGSQSAQITSQSSIPQTKAAGLARFKNLTQSEVSIPAGTVIYSVGQNTVRFVTMNDTHLAGTVNAFVDVPITAEQPGAIGNLPANSIQAIEGSVGLSASVTNPEPTTGGTDVVATAPSDDDRRRVHDVLLSVLQADAERQIRAAIGAKDLLLENTLQMGQVVNETYNPPAGQAGSLLTLTMSVEYRAQYVTADDLTRLAQMILNAAIPSGYVADANSLSFRETGVPASDSSGASHFEVQATRTLIHQINSEQASALVRGLSPRAAVQRLQSNLPLAAAPQIDVSPSWWPWLPLIPFRIEVN